MPRKTRHPRTPTWSAMLIAATLAVALATPSFAELQNITMGGSIRIRGNYVSVPGLDFSLVEQRTRLSTRADFSDGVSTVIELDSYDMWGEDFRSNYVTGFDQPASFGPPAIPVTRPIPAGATEGDLGIYQAYIEVNEMFGTPLRLRAGRQEMALGGQWLVGTADVNPFFVGLSFDAIRLTYGGNSFTVDGWWSKLAETASDFNQDDGDFFGLYGSYTGIENITLDAYWMYLRDDGVLAPPVLNAKDSDLHTVGLRLAGGRGAFDFSAEVAYQFGDVDTADTPIRSLFGLDNDLDYGEFGADIELGYSFDAPWKPRAYIGGAFLGGGDDDTLAFNRLFTNREYLAILDDSDLSNFWVARGGVILHPTDALLLVGEVIYLEADETPVIFEHFVVPTRASDKLGTMLAHIANYRYSSDLSIELGYFHMFTDDGFADGSFVRGNGLGLWKTEKQDYDYLYLETKIEF